MSVYFPIYKRAGNLGKKHEDKMPGRISSEQNKEVLSAGLCGAGLHTCNCSVESLNVVVQTNWPLPARQTLVMQFGAVS